MIKLELRLPAFYLPLLINGDDSGLTKKEITAIDQWYEKEIGDAEGHFGDWEDEGFCHRHELTPYGIKACDCATIHFVIMEESDYVF
jgi:hypothetical protein